MALAQVVTASKQIQIGPSKFHGIFVSSTSSGTIAVYNSGASSTSDPLIVSTVTPTAGAWIPAPPGVGATCGKGIYVVTSNTIAATVYYE